MDVVNQIVRYVLAAIFITIIIINIPVSHQSSRFVGDTDSFSIIMENSSISFKSKSIELLANEIVFYSPKYIIIEYNNGTVAIIDSSPIQIEYNKKVPQLMTDIEISLFLNDFKVDKDYIYDYSIFSGEVNRNMGDYRQLTSINQKVVINKNSVNHVFIENENITDFKQITFEMDNTSFAHIFTDQINIKAYGISEFKSTGQLSQIILYRGEGILGLDDHEFDIKSDDILNIEMMANYNSRLSADDEKITFHGITSSARLNNQNIMKNNLWYMLKFKPEKINAYATLLLAFITIVYVVFTGQIVKQTEKNIKQTENIITESEKERKVTFIMKRLEEFYYPLNDLLKGYVNVVKTNNDNNDVFERELRIRQELHLRTNRNIIKNYQDVINHQYLAENDTKVILDQFLDECIVKDRTTEKEDLNCYDKLIELIERDITKLRNDLEKLLNK